MRGLWLVRKALTAVLGVLALAVSLVVVAPATGASAAASPKGGTVVFAEQPQAPPNFIFPFMNLAYFSVYNINQFQYLMYRPLYWFGKGTTPDLNLQLSLADNPVFSKNNTQVVIKLKNYKWSDGESVTAQDVMFWMNMLHAEKTNWAAYAPGGNQIPDNVKNVVINSPTQLTFTLTGSYNPYFYTYNQLSQITPLPVAWDKTSPTAAPGSGGCSAAAYGTADAACAAVYTFLSTQSGYNPNNPKAANNSLPTYATNPLWQVVDGPWHLTHFDATGNVTMAPNPSYSGPVKPTISKFVEVPYTSDTAEYNALVGGKLSYGYLPPQDITANAVSTTQSGPNNPRLKGKFNLLPLYGWAINYFPYNFNSTGDNGAAGKIFSQLYFRQAVQYLVDQPLYINRVAHGYGVPTYGPVPVTPPNSFASSFEKSNPYPYNPGKAKTLLKDHGWKVVPGGTDTCVKPGSGANECGAGIPAGAKLAFTLQYATGATITTNTMNAEKSSWAQAGINMNLTTASFNTVIGNAVPCPSGCSWELENWGAGWIYAPDYYPSGEELFATGAGSNSGNYSDPTADQLIKATNVSNTPLTSYENYLAKQLPVIWQPNYANPMVEISKNLKGATPVNVLQQITPEAWRLK
ncbi:MAG: ABC transporter substrate-binding protein [Acidimicrobiales bacterium]